MKPLSKKDIDELNPEQLEKLAIELEETSKLSIAATVTIKKNEVSDQDKEQVKRLFESKS